MASEVDARTAGTGAIDYGGGCLALRPSLRQVSCPVKFSPRVPTPYNGDMNPTRFLQVYSTAMAAAGADHKVMANWFPLALGLLAQKWIMNIPEGSIRSWRDLCEQFVNAFQGGYKRPGTMNDLYALVQELNEMLCHFMQRFSHVSHNIP